MFIFMSVMMRIPLRLRIYWNRCVLLNMGQGNILELIITRSSDNIIKGTPSLDSFLSDHCSALCCLNVTKALATVKHIIFRKLKSLDLVAFKNDIASSDLCNIASNDCNEVAELYNNWMRFILDRHAPMTSKRVFDSLLWLKGYFMLKISLLTDFRVHDRTWNLFALVVV